MENNNNPFEEKNFKNEDIDNEEIIEDEENLPEDIDNSAEETVESEECIDENNELQEKYEDLNNKYIRLAADFDNFRKRTQQEKEELSQYAISKTLAQIAGVLDTFDRAQEHLKDVEECKVVKEGYEVAYKQLVETLRKIGMEEIEALAKPFNPNEHEAVTQIPTDEFETDHVAVVMQKGYKLGDRVIRPALVGVAVKKEG